MSDGSRNQRTERGEIQELRGDLHDLYDAITGLGIELEALNMSTRALTAHLIGEDPLRSGCCPSTAPLLA